MQILLYLFTGGRRYKTEDEQAYKRVLQASDYDVDAPACEQILTGHRETQTSYADKIQKNLGVSVLICVQKLVIYMGLLRSYDQITFHEEYSACA